MGLRFFVGVVALALAGCAGPNYGSIKSSLPSVPPGKARITIFRESNFFVGEAVTLHVFLNNREIGALPSGTMLQVDVPPGTNRLHIDRSGVVRALTLGLNKFPDIDLTTEAGKQYYVELGTGSCNRGLLGVGGCALADSDSNMQLADSCESGWCLGLRDEAYARAALDKLTVEQPYQ